MSPLLSCSLSANNRGHQDSEKWESPTAAGFWTHGPCPATQDAICLVSDWNWHEEERKLFCLCCWELDHCFSRQLGISFLVSVSLSSKVPRRRMAGSNYPLIDIFYYCYYLHPSHVCIGCGGMILRGLCWWRELLSCFSHWKNASEVAGESCPSGRPWIWLSEAAG